MKKTGEFYIIEVKSERERGDNIVEMKRKAIERLQSLQPDKFKYNIVYTNTGIIDMQEISPVSDWVNNS